MGNYVKLSSFLFRFQMLAAKNTDNVNIRNAEGHTPLHLACLCDKPDCVKALLAAGADANVHSARSGSASSEFSIEECCL